MDQTLTQKDIEVIEKIVSKRHTTCLIGLTKEDVWAMKATSFTPDEVSQLKKILKAFDGSAKIIGSMIIVAIISGVIALLTKGFWVAVK